MEIDRPPMDDFHIRLYSGDFGEDFVANRLREGFDFRIQCCCPLTSNSTLGETYKDYAEKRDGIVELGAAPNGGRAALLFT